MYSGKLPHGDGWMEIANWKQFKIAGGCEVICFCEAKSNCIWKRK